MSIIKVSFLLFRVRILIRSVCDIYKGSKHVANTFAADRELPHLDVLAINQYLQEPSLFETDMLHSRRVLRM